MMFASARTDAGQGNTVWQFSLFFVGVIRQVMFASARICAGQKISYDMLSLLFVGVLWQMMFASARNFAGQGNIVCHLLLVVCWAGKYHMPCFNCSFLGRFGSLKVLTAVGYDIGVRLAMPHLHLLPPMVVGQIRNRAGMIGLPDGLYAPAPGLRLALWQGPQQFQPERQEPLMLEDIRRDEVEEENEENWEEEEEEEEEEDQKGSPQADAVENDEKSAEEEYVLV